MVVAIDLVCVCRVWFVAVVAGTDLVYVCRVWIVVAVVVAGTDLVCVCRVWVVVAVVAVVVDLHGGSGTGYDAPRSRCVVYPGVSTRSSFLKIENIFKNLVQFFFFQIHLQ